MPTARNLAEAVAIGVLLALSTLCLIEFKRAKGVAELQTQAQRANMADLKVWLKGEMDKSRVSTRIVSERRAALRRGRGEGTAVALDVTSDPSLPVPEAEAELEATPEPDPGPPLPPKVGDPLVFLKTLDPESFYADSELHEVPRALTSTERLRVGCDLAITRAKVAILDKEIQLACIENLDRLRAEGAYREYAKGQPPMSEGRGVITFGEVTETGSSRIFAFPPDEYGEIYEKRAEQRALSEGLVRRLMACGTPAVPASSDTGG